MENILPYQGEAFYYSLFFNEPLANKLFNDLLVQTDWKHDIVVLFGKRITTKRKTAWHGTKPFVYKYSGSSKVALPFTDSLNLIRDKIHIETGVSFNSCLLNYYENGTESMGWHSDDEKSLMPQMPIASISLGASRKFSLKNKASKKRIDWQLQHGSLLMMNPPTQQFWQHSLPKTTKVNDPRINLTFRIMKEETVQ